MRTLYTTVAILAIILVVLFLLVSYLFPGSTATPTPGLGLT